MKFAARLVRKTVESVLRKGEVPPVPAVLPEELASIRTGIFVSAFENPGRKPRGRVGSLLPTKSALVEEIMFQTLRLLETYPFRKEDLPYLTYELLLTGPPSLLSILSALQSDEGLLVRTSQGKHGVSLPGANKTRSPEERFREACAHGHIDPRIEDTRLYHFTVETVAEVV